MHPTAIATNVRPHLATIAVLAILLVASGCSHYDPQPVSIAQNPTLEDAQRQGKGTATAKAPAQLHLGFGEQTPQQQTGSGQGQESAEQARSETTLRALAEPRTFLGTIPCQNPGCDAARISLTLSPAGHWRARFTSLGSAQAPSTAQGCWNVVSQDPPRIILLLPNDVVMANLGFENDNVMRIHQIYGTQPMLAYRLTRQAEIDPIDELEGESLPECTPN